MNGQKQSIYQVQLQLQPDKNGIVLIFRREIDNDKVKNLQNVQRLMLGAGDFYVSVGQNEQKSRFMGMTTSEELLADVLAAELRMAFQTLAESTTSGSKDLPVSLKNSIGSMHLFIANGIELNDGLRRFFPDSEDVTALDIKVPQMSDLSDMIDSGILEMENPS